MQLTTMPYMILVFICHLYPFIYHLALYPCKEIPIWLLILPYSIPLSTCVAEKARTKVYSLFFGQKSYLNKTISGPFDTTK